MRTFYIIVIIILGPLLLRDLLHTIRRKNAKYLLGPSILERLRGRPKPPKDPE